MKPLVWHERMLMVEFFLEKGSTVPLHSHPNEQTGYMVSGNMKLTIDKIEYDIHPGDSYSIPEGIEHKAEVILNSVVIDIFSPIRQDYMPENIR